MQVGWSMSLAFVPCELGNRAMIEIYWRILYVINILGERVTAAYIAVCDAIDKLDWYAYPIEMQKTLPFILINAQQPVTLKCFGSISCGREVFKRVSIDIRFTLLMSFIFQSIKFNIYILFLFILLDNQQCVFVFYDSSSIQLK